MSVARPPTRTPPGRLRRREARTARQRRSQLVAAGALAVLLLGAGAYWLLARPGTGGSDRPAERQGPATLTALVVRVEPEPFVAVIGSGGEPDPVAVTVPSRVVLEIPGLGSGTVGQAAGLPAPILATALSNMLGAWVDHHVVMDGTTLASTVDAMGGVTVNLGGTLSVGEDYLGPGPTELTGEQLAAYLSGGLPFERMGRWQDAVEALLAAPIVLPAEGSIETDDPLATESSLRAAAGASIRDLPVLDSGGNLLRPDQEAIARLVASAFGQSGEEPTPVLVLNGVGTPGVGQSVAELLVPEGFRIVASENARSFDHARTEIVVSDPDLEPKGERVRNLLGVGTVIVGGQRSGLADITIVVGRDFLKE